jgi:DNA-directed RNA polymerase subunit omega
MLDDLKEEAIVNKVGGRFKLSTLIQKRMVALNTGAKPLVDLRSHDKMAIVVQEILQDKIFLDVAGNLQARNATTSETIKHMLFVNPNGAPQPAPTPTAQPASAAIGGADDED